MAEPASIINNSTDGNKIILPVVLYDFLSFLQPRTRAVIRFWGNKKSAVRFSEPGTHLNRY